MLIQRTWSERHAAMFLALVATAILVIVPTCPALAAEQVKIGYLDLDRVVQAVARQTPEYEELRKELEKREAEVGKRRAEISELQETIF